MIKVPAPNPDFLIAELRERSKSETSTDLMVGFLIHSLCKTLKEPLKVVINMLPEAKGRMGYYHVSAYQAHLDGIITLDEASAWGVRKCAMVADWVRKHKRPIYTMISRTKLDALTDKELKFALKGVDTTNYRTLSFYLSPEEHDTLYAALIKHGAIPHGSGQGPKRADKLSDKEKALTMMAMAVNKGVTA